jgi:hypothetical protein
MIFQYENAKVKLDPIPERPADMLSARLGISKARVWAKGTEWIYGGASPFPLGTCQCPQLRVYLDWYKRSFVPELYRRSVGVVDGNGNLITHIGRYGNWDSGSGPKSRIKVGGDNIAFTFVRYLSATDNYLVVGDRGERLIVLKLAYHQEETVSIAAN